MEKNNIFDYQKYQEFWDFIKYELEQLTFVNYPDFETFADVKEYCIKQLRNKYQEIEYDSFFKCKYADKECPDSISCSDVCPFEGIEHDQLCMNGYCDTIFVLYDAFWTTTDERHFNIIKQICIECAEKIRNWPIKEMC